MTHYNDIYLCMKSIAKSYSALETSLDKLALQSEITIRDLSDESDVDKYNKASNIVNAERKRSVSVRDLPFRITLLKMDKENILIIFAACTELVSETMMKPVLIELFGTANVEHLTYKVNAKNSTFNENMEYWDAIFDKSMKLPTLDAVQESDFSISEVFAVDKDIIENLSKFEYNGKAVSPKTFFTAVWGLIQCKWQDRNRVMFEILHENSEIKRLPVRVDNLGSFKEICAFVDKQFMDAPRYDWMTLDKIELGLCRKLEQYIGLSQDFFVNATFQKIIIMMKQGTVYHLEHYSRTVRPLNVAYYLENDSAYMEYTYNQSAIGNHDVESLHKMFCLYARQILLSAGDTSIDFSDMTKDINNAVRRKAKIGTYLTNSSFSGTLEKKYAMRLMEKCSLVDCMPEENISLCDIDNEAEGYVYVIGEGNVSIEGVDSKFNAHPLMLLKAGDVFGIEEFIGAEDGKCQYVVQSDVCRLIRIKVSDLKLIAYEQPGLYEALLKIQTSRLARFQKLWMMS